MSIILFVNEIVLIYDLDGIIYDSGSFDVM